MAISGINSYNSISAYNNTPKVNNYQQVSSSVQPTSVYGSDSVSILAKSASQMSILASGGIAGYKYSGSINEVAGGIGSAIKAGSAKEIMNSVTDGGKTLAMTSANAAGMGALISGGTSLVTNGFSLISGRTTAGNATANIASDTIKGALAGVGGAVGGGVTSMAMKLIGFSGTPLVVVGVIGGVVGGALAGNLVNTDSLKNKIRSAID